MFGLIRRSGTARENNDRRLAVASSCFEIKYEYINCKMLPKVTHMVIDTVPLVLNGTS